MKKLSILLAFMCFAVGAQVRMPVLSPGASISRVVGVTKVTIDYSSPGVRGREGKIWGGLVPYDVTWRAGANAPTTISFQDEVKIGGKTIPKGSYSLFITPGKDKWKVHLNKGNAKGRSVFDFMVDGKTDLKAIEATDLATLSLTPQKLPTAVEHLNYDITLVDQASAKITMTWEKVSLSFIVKTDPIGSAEKTATAQFHWQTAARTAQFYLDNKMKLEEAELLARYSVKSQDHFYNKWVLAQVLYSKGAKKEAVDYAKAAQSFGTANPSGFYNNYKDRIAEALKTW